MRRLWRLKSRSGKRATVQKRTNLPDGASYSASHENVHYHAAMELVNDLISTSMRNIVQARLRNIVKRSNQINIFQQMKRDAPLL